MLFFKRSISNQLIIVVLMLLVSFLSTTAYAVEPDLPNENKLLITPTPQSLEQPSIDTIYLPWLNKDKIESSVPQSIKPNQASLILSGYEIHTLTLRIQQSSDDAQYHSYDGYQHTQTNDPIGEGGVGTPSPLNGIGWRFTNVTIPPGATILSARLSLVKHGDHWSDWNFRWHGQATDNAATFSSNSHSHPAGRFPHTIATVQHSDNINHLDGVRYSLDDLAPIIQEIIDRPKWRPGNALAIMVRARGGWDRKWWRTFDYDNDPNGPNVPELVIHYKVPLIPSNVILVDDTATGANDGNSWADAYTSLQTALAAATAGDEIWVAAGVYTPGSSRHDSFSLKNDVAIYGGFAGYEIARTQRDYDTGSVLSGDIGGDDITDSQGIVTNTNNIIGENSYHVISNKGILNTAILDGFIITGGNANGDTLANRTGGGMDNHDNSRPTLTNLTFTGNFANIGGGMFSGKYGHPTLTDITFIRNSADGGGGMYTREGHPALTDVTFMENFANFGGGIFTAESAPILTDVTFIGNSASAGGGMYSSRRGPTLTDVTFIGNSASAGGGGIYCSEIYHLMLTNVDFIKNSANYGGGMNSYRCEATLTDITFIENSAIESNSSIGRESGQGGGLHNYKSWYHITNATFIGNSSTNTGGGVFSQDGGLTFENVTFTGNSASTGGGMFIDTWDYMPSFGEIFHLTNVIMWGNTAVSGGSQISAYPPESTLVRQSIIEGSGGSGPGWDTYLATDGGNNIDPLFITGFYPE